MPGALGGARPGAGRPRKSEKHAGQIAKAEKLIADRLPALIENMLELANGVMVREHTELGGLRIYTKPPSLEANRYLLDRIMGSPIAKSKAEVTGPGGGPIRITEVIIEHEEAEESLDA